MVAARQSGSSSSAGDLIEDLLVEILGQQAQDRSAAIQAVCTRHPEHAETLRRRLSLLESELPTNDDPPATFGRFTLIRRLGGGTADVFLARDPGREDEVVVKVLRNPQLLDPETRASFEREALASARLRHPGIGAVLELGEVDGTPYLVQPYRPGPTLAEWIARHRRPRAPVEPADLDLVLAWLAHVARALDVAHRVGLVHRDVKPANILLPRRGPACLLDFGLCQEARPACAAEPALPIGGTLAYMAPELLSPRQRPVGPGADVWALGVTLFEAVTGRLPFLGDTRHALCFSILTHAAPDPRGFTRRLPRDLSRVLACALAKDASERYGTAAAFADDLERLRRGERVVAPAARLWPRCRRIAGERPWLLAAAVAALASVPWWWSASPAPAADQDADLLSVGALVRDAEAAAAKLVPGWPDQVVDIAAWLRAQGEPLASMLPRLRQRSIECGADPARAMQAHVLGEALAALESFVAPHGALPAMRERLAWAEVVAARTIEAPAAAWRTAIDAIAADPRFFGLRLAPQLDLVPLGPDPRSGLQEFYHPRSAWPDSPPVWRDPQSQELRLHDGSGLVFVLVPEGHFVMGHQHTDPAGPRYDPYAGHFARPHEVHLSPFFLSKYEMTQAQWWRLTGEMPSWHRIGQVVDLDPAITWRHPVESVTATRCDEVLGAVGLRLPTESQWEFACGTGAPGWWFFGDDPRELARYANVADRRFVVEAGWSQLSVDFDDGYRGTAPVGRFAANPFGLHDILGNVSEWCLDRWGSYAEWPHAAGDGLRSPVPAEDRHRSYRGGSFHEDPRRRGKTSSRMDSEPGQRLDYLGLRPARPIHPEAR